MTQKRRNRMRRRRIIALSLFTLIVAGCAQTVADWTPRDSSKDIEVQWVTLEHTVAFADTDDAVTRIELRRLDNFLAQLNLRPGDQLFVDLGKRRDAAFEDPRIALIAQQLRHHLPEVRLIQVEGMGAPGRSAKVIVGRYIAMTPNCPDWSRPSSSNSGNFNDSNFGCATQTNLGRMVADPGDLFRGRDLTPADSMAMSAGIRRYRAGETKTPVLPKEAK